jgi:nucleoside-diphosphate-sugar epimerase/glycosyltransferase involved in cell wall biosynthesis
MQPIDKYVDDLKGPIVVLGASGFIGANLFHKIYSKRRDVFGLVHSEKGWRLSDIPEENIIIADLNDAASAKNFINTIHPRTVFDLVAYGAYSFEVDASKIYETNFNSLISRVSILTDTDISAYIHAGSSSEYGTNSSSPKEDGFCEPNSHYSVSKIASANYLRYMGKRLSFPCINLRLYSVYGPLEDSSRLIPTMLKKALGGELPPLVNPNISRDFVYIDDVCQAFLMAASKIHPDLYGESYNIGTGVKTAISDLVDLVIKKFKINKLPEFNTMTARSWDQLDWVANAKKAQAELGWSALTPLEDGLITTSEWVSNLGDLKFAKATKLNNSEKSRSISAVIACYKDQEAISHMYERLKLTFDSLGIEYEIIFVNDGSPDGTAQVIQDISRQDPNVLGINHSRNFGSQMAFRSGMELATKSGVVLLDGDLQDPPELINEFYKKWNEGYDVIYGRRVKREMSWYKELPYKAFYRLFAAFSYINIPHDAGDFSLMDRRVVNWLLNCPERDVFMRGLRAYVGFRQAGVNYVRPERMFGVTTNNFFKNLEWAKRGIFSFSNTPLTFLTFSGIILFLFSITIAVVIFALKLFIPEIAPRGITTVLISNLLFGSFNLFAIGLVGEYVAKILIEVKGRPRLIRSSLIRDGNTTNLLPNINSFHKHH